MRYGVREFISENKIILETNVWPYYPNKYKHDIHFYKKILSTFARSLLNVLRGFKKMLYYYIKSVFGVYNDDILSYNLFQNIYF